MELFSLKDKVSIVTGALGLIGRKHCEALADAGSSVIVADVDEEKAIAFAASLGRDHTGVYLDVTDESSIQDLKNIVTERYDRLDVLVNNAAINDMFENPALAKEYSAFENYPLSAFQQSIDVNITGVFLCSQILGQIMVEQQSGSIINIASTYGIVAPDQNIYKDEFGEQTFYKSAAYPVTKGAVISFTRFLAAYWGNKGIRVNTLSPGGVSNNQDDFFIQNYAAKTLLGRMATSSDYQGALVFLASDASLYMTGANLVVDGGWTAI
jgi:NAD(P)-dependent dehydrogenase (short-subunit alcohol dehydrogenase family)